MKEKSVNVTVQMAASISEKQEPPTVSFLKQVLIELDFVFSCEIARVIKIPISNYSFVYKGFMQTIKLF